MKEAKKHITEIVKLYVKLNLQEFEDFKKGVQMMRELKHDDYASAANMGSKDTRALFEMPVTLHEMLINNLTDEELEWFKAGGPNRKDGGLWFARSFPAFRIPEKI